MCIVVYHKEDYLVNVKLMKFAEILSNFSNLFKQETLAYCSDLQISKLGNSKGPISKPRYF